MFWVLTEIVSLHDLSQCLPMVQYAAELNDNIGKFTFTYQYDMKFHLKKQIKPSTLWNVIDNHLWPKCFTDAAKESTFHSGNQSSAYNFCSQRTCDSISEHVPKQNASSNINVPNVTKLGKLKETMPHFQWTFINQHSILNYKNKCSSQSLQFSIKCLTTCC